MVGWLDGRMQGWWAGRLQLIRIEKTREGIANIDIKIIQIYLNFYTVFFSLRARKYLRFQQKYKINNAVHL